MSRNLWKKLAIKVAAVGMVFAVGMSEKVYAAEEGGVELPIAVYGSGDQSGYVDGTNKKVSWTYDAATKTVTITGSSKRKPEFWSQGPGFPRDTEQIVFIDCVLSGSMTSFFKDASNVKNIDVSGLTMQDITNTTLMFYGCTSLDTSNFDFSSLIYERSTDDGMKPFDPVEKMLEECNCLESFTTPSVMGRAQIQLPGIFTDGTTKMISVNADYVNTLLKKIMVVNAFEDVAIDQWYVPYIQYVYDKGLMNGTSETTFEPNMTLTREMFAVILYSMAGKPEVMADNPFSDVLEDKWYTEAVLWAYNEGIVSGIGGNKYGVESEITREQLALMMYGYAKKCGKNSNIKEGVMDGFADAGKVSDWASDAIQWAISQGVMNGKPGEGGVMNPEPDGKATRAECATMVMRLAQLQ